MQFGNSYKPQARISGLPSGQELKLKNYSSKVTKTQGISCSAASLLKFYDGYTFNFNDLFLKA